MKRYCRQTVNTYHYGNTLSLSSLFYVIILLFVKQARKFVIHPYLLLEDYYYCKYRLFLKTKDVYLKNTYGLGASANIHFRHEQMFSETQKQIIVYDKSHTAHKIDREATALDFAFYLHPDIGYCAKSAFINNSAEERPLNTKLENGDSINIVSDSQEKIYHAKLEWFEYVNTKKSTKLLISFFLEHKNLI